MQGNWEREGCWQLRQIVFTWMAKLMALNIACFSLSLTWSLGQIEA